MNLTRIKPSPRSERRDEETRTLTIVVPVECIVSTRNQVRSAFLRHLDWQPRLVILDFSQTCRIDSAGMGVLLGIDRKLKEINGALILSGVSGELRADFANAQVERFFNFLDTP